LDDPSCLVRGISCAIINQFLACQRGVRRLDDKQMPPRPFFSSGTPVHAIPSLPDSRRDSFYSFGKTFEPEDAHRQSIVFGRRFRNHARRNNSRRRQYGNSRGGECRGIWPPGFPITHSSPRFLHADFAGLANSNLMRPSRQQYDVGRGMQPLVPVNLQTDCD